MATDVTLSPEFLEFARRSTIKPGATRTIVANQIDAGDLRLNYLDWLGPAERPVVFVHGGGLTARTWDLVCLALSDRYRCLALDLRGHGDSDRAPDLDYRLETHAGDVARFVESQGLEDAVLVGHSLGGQSCLLCAAGPLAPRGLVLVDVGPEPNIDGTQRIVDAIHKPQEYEYFEDAVERAMLLNPRRDPAVLRDSLKNNLRQLPNGYWTWKYDWQAFVGMTREVRLSHRELLWGAVDAVTCPTLVVRGSESEILSDEQAKELCDRLDDCEWHVVENAGHTVQGDNPAGLVAFLEPFLARLWGLTPTS